jgi:class 3 adenylate cyclase/tetratricopeptide (TPR) repeat protein
MPTPSPLTVPAAELRLVSVLFCDLEGHTARSETLEPDVVRDLLTGYFDTARAIIDRHGGVVEKFIGDAVMAVWGLPVALENDAERAVRAALELVDSIEAYGERIGVAGLRGRVGVVTGRAAALDGEDGLVAGDRVNTAARIQSLAQPGEVLVDAVTRETTSAAIAYRDAGLHALKGKADPIQVWRAERAIGGALGVTRGDELEADLVGRDRELRLLKELFHATVERGTARIVSVVGPAGVGKSRLRWEFEKYVDGLVADVRWHLGRCLSFGDGVAYWALAQVVRQRMNIAEQDPPDVARDRLREGLARWIPDPGDREYLEPRLAQLLGLADASLSRDDLFGGWRLFFQRLAEGAPVVIVIEDLHWGDDGLLDFLDSLLDWSATHPIFVLTLARPELVEVRPGWGQRANGTSIGLEPLDQASMRALLDELVAMPPVVADRVVEQAEGIPLYAVEIVRSLIEQGNIEETDDGRRRVIGPVDDLAVPATLTALLSARVDHLPPDERTLVRDLAVLGTSFPRAAVDAVASPTETPVERLLTNLVRRGVLTILADPLSPERGQLQFAQAMMRAVVYDTLTRRERKARHLAVAAHLQRVFQDEGAEVAEVVAVHLRHAIEADPEAAGAEELRSRAAAAFRRAGDRAFALGAAASALGAYRSAGEVERDELTHAELLLKAGRAAGRLDRFDESIPLIEQSIGEFQALGRDEDARVALHWLIFDLYDSGRTEEADRRLEAELARLPDDAMDIGGARLVAARASMRSVGGINDEETTQLIERAVHLAEGLGDRSLLARVTMIAGLRHLSLGHAHMARILTTAALEAAREVDDLEQLQGVLINTTQVLTGEDEFPMGLLREGLEVSRRLGRTVGIGLAAGNLCRALVRTGDWAAAGEVAHAVVEELGTSTAHGLGEPLLWLSQLAAWRGEHDEARAYRERADAFAFEDDAQDESIYAGNELMLRAAAGRLDGLAQDIAARVEIDVARHGWRFDTVPFTWPLGIEIALRTDELAAADRLIRMLAAVPVGARPPYLSAELRRATLNVALARGEEPADAEAVYRDVIERLDGLGLPVPAASARLDLASWLVAAGRPEEAADLSAAARVTAERLGAVALLDRLDPLATTS